ncbi:DNA polymerase-3 subunit epsilon [Pontibacter ummariensis]|uniref:DNA polymerase-3 subunit epsilon n=1 Tax=Pontibacter ummariensis TaxID=1610492 RepID=A0A239J7W8_9BACT|nr:3'-5' exonuclease [Pontibacter ummariensis]PRY08922.1 DNA polymerase-3 subunit epsilon [Pontibacter ummariensis]SNT01895.1 DNA polymerase-3 subunit epsilon [Pontibacter ummariensis]
MKLNLKRPIVFFDLETTGTDICKDRIVEISVLKVMPDGEEILKTRRINPTIPIPLESSLIHKIYDEDVKDCPTFKQIARDLDQFLRGCDLGGYNLLRFDIPLLAEEFLRCEIDFDIENRHVVDACRIFHQMEQRTLSAAYKYYCNKKLDNAHSAEADTIATYHILMAQLDRYQDTPVEVTEGVEEYPIQNNMEQLHKFTVQKTADLSGRIVYNNAGQEVFNFGKYKNVPVEEVLQKEPSYYDWMMKGDFPLYTKKILTRIRLRSVQLS